jgi:hypothetical protein
MMINEWGIRKDKEGSGRDQISGIIQEFSDRDEENSRETCQYTPFSYNVRCFSLLVSTLVSNLEK